MLRLKKKIRDLFDAQRDRIVILLIVVAFCWLAWQQHENGATSGTAHTAAMKAGEAADQAKRTAGEGKTLAQAIQQQRVDIIVASCEEQANRNHSTLTVLHHIYRQAEHKLAHAPAQRAQLRQSLTATTLLIDALAPLQDCKARAEHFAGGASGPAGTIPPSPVKKGRHHEAQPPIRRNRLPQSGRRPARGAQHRQRLRVQRSR